MSPSMTLYFDKVHYVATLVSWVRLSLSECSTEAKSAIYDCLVGPILWGHSGPLCHTLSLLSLLLSKLSLWTSILHCHSPGVATFARRLRCSYSWLRLILVVVSTLATPGELQCKIRTGGVRRLAMANAPNIFQMLLVLFSVLCSKLSWLLPAFERTLNFNTVVYRISYVNISPRVAPQLSHICPNFARISSPVACMPWLGPLW